MPIATRRIALAALALASLVPPAAAETSCGYMVREMYWVCRARGAGDPVMFVHGALSDASVWDGQADLFAKSYYVAVPNLRHHGTSAVKTPEPYSHLLHVRDLEDFLMVGALGPLRTSPAHIVGHGFGAELALLVAQALPKRVRSLVLHEPDFESLAADAPGGADLLRQRDAQLTWVRGLAYGGSYQRAAGAYYRWLTGGDASRQIMGHNPDDFGFIPEPQRLRLMSYARTLSAHLTMPPPKVTCADLGAMKLPVLVTVGETTRPYFKLVAETMARCIPGARLAVIPGAGHGAPYENPEAFNRVLADFLAKP